MRKKFVNLLQDEMGRNKDIILISADLGFGLFDDIRKQYPKQFINVMSSEQLMLGIAAGLTLEKKIAVCYSITPFLLYRPFEWIVNYLQHDKLPVKLVGGGRMDYNHLGNTHNTDLDIKIMTQLDNIKIYYPDSEIDLIGNFNEFLYNNKPSYINLKR